MKVYILLLTLEVIVGLPIDKKSAQNETKDVLVSKESGNIEQNLSKNEAINVAVAKANENALYLKQIVINKERHDDMNKENSKQESLGIADRNRNEKIKHKNTKIDLEKESPPSVPIKEKDGDDYDDVQIVSYSAFVGDGCATGLAKINGICADIDY